MWQTAFTMKLFICLFLLVTVAACGKPAKPAIRDVAANRMNNEDVTDVADESADDSASGENSIDPD